MHVYLCTSPLIDTLTQCVCNLCMCVHVCVHVCACVCCMCVHTYVSFVCACVCCMCVCWRVCVCVCIWVHVCVCVVVCVWCGGGGRHFHHSNNILLRAPYIFRCISNVAVNVTKYCADY